MPGNETDSSTLTALQRDLLREFFARERRFFLTGGAALAGYTFHHRTTDDLDLFAAPPLDLDEGDRALGDCAQALGLVLTRVSRHADFHRWRAVRGSETCIVDLVLDRAPMIDSTKREVGAIRLDTLRELAANKVCALIGRSEVRDLVDLRVLLGSGIELESALRDAATKEAGADPATLAWTLSQLALDPQAKLPGGVSAVELDAFRLELIAQLTRLARAAAP